MYKFLVTGGAGMIGLEVCKQLSKSGHFVHLFDLGEQVKRVQNHIPKKNIKIFYGSIIDTSALREAMQDCDIVIHLAALLGVKRSEDFKLKCLEINVEGTKNVLTTAIERRVKKFIFASSSEVYGEPLDNPIKEDFITQGKTIYAISKLMGEEYCKAFNQQFPINFTILRYFNCYGPFQTAQFVMSKFIKNALEGKNLHINGDGGQVRSYTYVYDTAKATILASLSSKSNGKVLNIGSGEDPINLIELAKLILKLTKKKKLKIIFDKKFTNKSDRNENREIYLRYCDSSLAKKTLNWKTSYSLEKGIKEVIKTGVIFDRWENFFDEQN